MEPTEIVYVDEQEICCDGGDPDLGHPAVYLTLEKDGIIDCPYCSRRFVHQSDDSEAA